MRIGLQIGLTSAQQKPLSEYIVRVAEQMAPIAHNGHLDPAALDYIRALGELGVDEVMVRYPDDPATFDLLATELIPTVGKIPVAGR